MTLKEFLKKHKVLTKFRFNYRNDATNEDTSEHHLKGYAHDEDGIISAFVWGGTPEMEYNPKFWSELNEEWRRICTPI